MSSQTAWLLMMSLFRQVLWFVALCRVKGNNMAILWGHGSPLAKTESYAMCSNITSTVLFVLRYYRYVWLMSNILSVCKWKYENKSTNILKCVEWLQKVIDQVLFALVRNWSFLTFTQTNLLVQYIFFIKCLTLHFDPPHAFGVSVQFVIRGSLKW